MPPKPAPYSATPSRCRLGDQQPSPRVASRRLALMTDWAWLASCSQDMSFLQFLRICCARLSAGDQPIRWHDPEDASPMPR